MEKDLAEQTDIAAWRHMDTAMVDWAGHQREGFVSQRTSHVKSVEKRGLILIWEWNYIYIQSIYSIRITMYTHVKWD